MWREKYKELMFSSDISKVDTAEGFKLKLYNVPRSLYKYRGISTNSLNNLQYDTTYFNRATDFNDPYDSALTIEQEVIHYEKSKGLLLEFWVKLFNVSIEEVKSVVGNLSLKEILELYYYYYSPYKDEPRKVPGLVDEFLRDTGELYDNYVAAISKIHQEAVYVSCFSEDAVSMLMWSHYANNHTGMCIEYDFNEMDMRDEALWGLHPVFYSESLLDLNVYSDEVRKKVFIPILASISKSKEWSYEEEWRMIFVKEKGTDPFNHKVSKPKSIILGSKVSEEDKNRVLEIAIPNNIPLKQVQLDRSKYGLTIVEL